MGDLIIARSRGGASATVAGAAVGAAVPAAGDEAAGSGAATGAIWAGATSATSDPALRPRSFKPTCSSSNSARSCSRTSSRTFLMSARFIADSDKEEVGGHVGQLVTTVCGNEHIILQPYAAESVDVGAGFNRADHAGSEVPELGRFLRGAGVRGGGPLCETGRLMDVEAQAMTGRVDERLAESVRRQEVAGRRIHFMDRRLRAHRRERGPLCGPHRVEQRASLGPDSAHSSHPGQVAAVSV